MRWMEFYRRFPKRALDCLLALAAATALLPLLAIVAALVRWRCGSPVLFVQERIGWRGRIFRIYKFRTMTEAVDAQGRLLPDEQRLTALGMFIRRASLDELPQLWNVIKGEMSLVGPRPLLPQYLARYTPQQARRHEVRPGITGWAQINGRNSSSWEEKFRLDVWYVEHGGFRLDCWIILQTVLRVVRRDGISADGHATAPEFFGSHEKKAA